eukprot:TRINITY_DN44737_c0_g1_i2.p1 TRINITY_DN44737_c0_g1~~TRINITY_DN44737_c0_g1_i2.p1  ORF type:complete len:114 (-),score=20.14 TRINITY_DN44737_c0_g1_i2:61-402(-)
MCIRDSINAEYMGLLSKQKRNHALGQPFSVVDYLNPKETLTIIPKKVENINPVLFSDGKNLHKFQGILEGAKLIYHQLDTFNPYIFRREKPEKYPVYWSTNLLKVLESLMKKS